MPVDKPKGQVVVSVSIPGELLDQTDARAGRLGMSRSQYVAMVVRKDVLLGGSLTIPAAGTLLNDTGRLFLKHAIPGLIAYERTRDEHDLPNPGEPLAQSDLWACFLNELDWILDYKWCESEKRGANIGHERAIREWLQKHHALWAAAQDSPAPK